jgi:hypothetical protein
MSHKHRPASRQAVFLFAARELSRGTWRASGSPHGPTSEVVSRVFRTLVWAERRPDRAQAIMALICCSFSSSMFRYLLVDHSLPAM